MRTYGPKIPVGPLVAALGEQGLPVSRRSNIRLADAWGRALASGRIGLYLADEIVCTLLKSHPSEVYGHEWFNFGEKERVSK